VQPIGDLKKVILCGKRPIRGRGDRPSTLERESSQVRGALRGKWLMYVKGPS